MFVGIGVVSETTCHPEHSRRNALALVSYGAGYHAYCLSTGFFVRKGVGFVTQWIELL